MSDQRQPFPATGPGRHASADRRATRRASAAAVTGFAPRPFAVVPHGTGAATVPAAAVLAWGMTLPDGSAVVVECRDGATLAAVCAGTTSAELLFDGAVRWLPHPGTGR